MELMSDQTSRWGCVQQPGNCQMPGCCMRSFVNCSYTFAARHVLTKVYLQECLTANNSTTKLDIGVISAPQCVSWSKLKDAEKCKN